MKKFIILLLLCCTVFTPVYAQELEAPLPPEDVQAIIPDTGGGFGTAVWELICGVASSLDPEMAQAVMTCISAVAVSLMICFFRGLPGESNVSGDLVSTVAIAAVLLNATGGLIAEAADTVQRLSDYGKLLLPVMTAALASQGGVTSAAAIYSATAVFDAVLTALIAYVLVPMTYVFLAVSLANSAIGEETLAKIRDFMKWLIGWSLKTLLYIFTGYVTITGVVSGVTDQATMKATKLTIAGMVPVVGGILSDASEALLVGAGLIRSTVGVAGLLAVIGLVAGPFLRIGIYYLMLKLTAALISMFSEKRTATLVQDFSAGMGFLLAMTGTVCVMLLISTVCFMKGVI